MTRYQMFLYCDSCDIAIDKGRIFYVVFERKRGERRPLNTETLCPRCFSEAGTIEGRVGADVTKHKDSEDSK